MTGRGGGPSLFTHEDKLQVGRVQDQRRERYGRFTRLTDLCFAASLLDAAAEP